MNISDKQLVFNFQKYKKCWVDTSLYYLMLQPQIPNLWTNSLFHKHNVEIRKTTIRRISSWSCKKQLYT